MSEVSFTYKTSSLKYNKESGILTYETEYLKLEISLYKRPESNKEVQFEYSSNDPLLNNFYEKNNIKDYSKVVIYDDKVTIIINKKKWKKFYNNLRYGEDYEFEKGVIFNFGRVFCLKIAKKDAIFDIITSLEH